MERVLVSGGFDPLHAGHIDMFAAAKRLGDHLIVAVNDDAWLDRKKGFHFMDLKMRTKIVRECRFVDEVVVAKVDAAGTIAPTIDELRPDILANGGDRVRGELPLNEVLACKAAGARMIYGVGGGKTASSSAFASNLMRREQQKRPWGGFSVIRRNTSSWVKIIEVDPYQATSLQSHKHRDEAWTVVTGEARITVGDMQFHMGRGEVVTVPRGTRHRIENVAGVPLVIVEVATGSPDEADIARHADMYGRSS